MDGDRELALLSQAHFDGLIDLSESRPFDRRWQRKLQWALRATENRNTRRLAEMHHDLHCGALTYLAGQKTLDTHWNQAIALESTMKKLLFPWLGGEDNTGVYRRLTSAWERQYGKMNDPETQKKIDAGVAELRRRSRPKRR